MSVQRKKQGARVSQLALIWGPLVIREGRCQEEPWAPWCHSRMGTEAGHQPPRQMAGQWPSLGPHSSLQFGPLCILLGD